MNATQAHLIVYNPISGHGHLDSWNAIFVKAFLEMGFQVTAMTPNVEVLRTSLRDAGVDTTRQLTIADWNISPLRPRTSWLSIWGQLEWQFVHGGAGRVSRHMPYAQIFLRPLLWLFFNIWHSVRQFLARVMAKRSGSRDFISPQRMLEQLEAIRESVGGKIDFVFVMYLDMFDQWSPFWKKFDRNLGVPWGGIRFAPLIGAHTKRFESYCTTNSLHGLCFLDEKSVQVYAEKFSAKVFQLIPDITNVLLPLGESPVVRGVLEAARGRKIVFMGGSLDARKNIGGFLRLATLANPEKYYFVLVGRIYEAALPTDEQELLAVLRIRPRENVLIYNEYLADERDFNALIKASSIVFAVYKNFHGSSNILTKAAYFQRAIVVSDRCLMGDRVLKYGIGAVVPEDEESMQSALVCIEQLVQNSPEATAFIAYQNDFSEQKIRRSLADFIHFSE